MKRLFFAALITTALTAVLPSCGPSTSAEDSQVRIATWNLEWFGALGRTPEDITRIAGIIEELKIDVLALQEITCPCTLEALAAELEWRYFISPQKTPQKLALMWNPANVGSVEFDDDAYAALERVANHGLERDSRQPLAFSITAGAFDFTLVDVHLKSIPESERSVEIRNVQYDAINDWLRTTLAADGAEQDIIIIGDFNSYRTGISSQRLLEAGLVEFATDTLPENEYSNIWYNAEGSRNLSFIDQIAVTPALRGGEFDHVQDIRDWDQELGSEYYESHISDHLPLVAVFRTDRDID